MTVSARAQADNAAPPKPEAEPMPVAEPPAFYRISVGAIECTILSDGGGPSPGSPQPIFAPDADPADVERILTDRYLPTDRSTSYFNAMLVKTGNAVVLIDAGSGDLIGPAGGKLEANLRASGVTPEQVTHVILTHAHLDHMGGLKTSWEANAGAPRFPNARLVASRAEHDFWTSAAPDLSGLRVPDDFKKRFLALGAATFESFKGATDLVQPGDRILPGIEILGAPGHTPGHICVLVRDGDASLLHMADVAHHFLLVFARPEWSPIYDADPARAEATRRRIFDMAAMERLNVVGYHMPWPGVGNIRRGGNGYEWLPRPWGL